VFQRGRQAKQRHRTQKFSKPLQWTVTNGEQLISSHIICTGEQHIDSTTYATKPAFM
jgi:hypothetical protein